MTLPLHQSRHRGALDVKMHRSHVDHAWKKKTYPLPRSAPLSSFALSCVQPIYLFLSLVGSLGACLRYTKHTPLETQIRVPRCIAGGKHYCDHEPCFRVIIRDGVYINMYLCRQYSPSSAPFFLFFSSYSSILLFLPLLCP